MTISDKAVCYSCTDLFALGESRWLSLAAHPRAVSHGDSALGSVDPNASPSRASQPRLAGKTTSHLPNPQSKSWPCIQSINYFIILETWILIMALGSNSLILPDFRLEVWLIVLLAALHITSVITSCLLVDLGFCWDDFPLVSIFFKGQLSCPSNLPCLLEVILHLCWKWSFSSEFLNNSLCSLLLFFFYSMKCFLAECHFPKWW